MSGVQVPPPLPKTSSKSIKQAYPQILLADIKELPIPNIKLSDQKMLVSLVDKILNAKKTDSKYDVSELEKHINELVFDLFQLTLNERQVVLNSFLKKKKKLLNTTPKE